MLGFDCLLKMRQCLAARHVLYADRPFGSIVQSNAALLLARVRDFVSTTQYPNRIVYCAILSRGSLMCA